MADRKKSPLGGRGPAGRGTAPALVGADKPALTQPQPPAQPQQTEPPAQERPLADLPRPAPVTRNPRRLRVVGRVSDDDLVSFNCKMSRGLRRAVRHFAADAEVDIQDVVAAALEEYLQDRRIVIPGADQRRPG